MSNKENKVRRIKIIIIMLTFGLVVIVGCNTYFALISNNNKSISPKADDAAKSATSLPDKIVLRGEVLSEHLIPIVAESKMLKTSAIKFSQHHGYTYVEVWFVFTDCKLDNAAIFDLKLFDEANNLIGESRGIEPQNRKLPIEYSGVTTRGGDDKPNRTGLAEFRVKSVAPGRSKKFALTVEPQK